MITAETLRRFAPRIINAGIHAAALETARLTSSVTTPQRLAYFMGQIFVETRGLTVFEEDLNYRDPVRLDTIFSAVRGVEDAKSLIARGPQAIANRVYANRLGNGDEASGDGWNFRGAGYKQLTGLLNFRELGKLTGLPLEEHPEMARQFGPAASIAFKFWDSRTCSPRADANDCSAITTRINGPAQLGLAERREATARALAIWP